MEEKKGQGTITISVDLDMNRLIQGATVFVEDEDSDCGGTEVQIAENLEELVLKCVVDRLVNNLPGLANDAYKGLASRVQSIRDELIREKLCPVLDDAINKAVQKTNSFGEPIGTPTSLRELIMAEAQKALAMKDNYNSDKTWLGKKVADLVQKVAEKELAEALGAAKADVKKAIAQKGAEILAEAALKYAGTAQ